MKKFGDEEQTKNVSSDILSSMSWGVTIKTFRDAVAFLLWVGLIFGVSYLHGYYGALNQQSPIIEQYIIDRCGGDAIVNAGGTYHVDSGEVYDISKSPLLVKIPDVEVVPRTLEGYGAKEARR